MVGENVKMLCEQIEEKKGKITRMFLDEEIHDRKVSKCAAIYLQTKEHMRREH
jgi:hypothetical protein